MGGVDIAGRWWRRYLWGWKKCRRLHTGKAADDAKYKEVHKCVQCGTVVESARLFLRLFFVVSAQGAPREDGLCGLRYSSVHHREVGVSRSDLRGAQGQVAHTWPLRLRWLGPEVCAYAG